MEEHHGQRRQLVWAELGEAPLALALEKLLVLAELTQNSSAAGTLDELSIQYQTIGWKVDDAVLKALSLIEKQDDCGCNCCDSSALFTLVRRVGKLSAKTGE